MANTTKNKNSAAHTGPTKADTNSRSGGKNRGQNGEEDQLAQRRRLRQEALDRTILLGKIVDNTVKATLKSNNYGPTLPSPDETEEVDELLYEHEIRNYASALVYGRSRPWFAQFAPHLHPSVRFFFAVTCIKHDVAGLPGQLECWYVEEAEKAQEMLNRRKAMIAAKAAKDEAKAAEKAHGVAQRRQTTAAIAAIARASRLS